MSIEKESKLIIISSPSGAGKTTLCKLLIKKMKNINLSISYTSRNKRLNEIQKRFPNIFYRVEGKGMIAAMIFNQNDTSIGSEIASKISWECFKRGVFVVHTGRESIKLGPPLVITNEALIESLDVIEEVIEIVNNEY